MAMFSFRSLGLGIPSWISGLTSISSGGISISSVHINDIEENSDKRARTLKHLLKANHINHSIIYNHLRFHNHCPHILGSAYILGADSDHLNKIYDAETKNLEPWRDAPGEISVEDWRSFLGKREYQRAYIDFFEDRLAHHGYDWKEVVNEYLLEGPEPLVNNLICGLAHPLIHLGYAFELSSPTVAIEALALTTCFYNDQHRYLDDPSYTKPAPDPTTDLLEILGRVAKDNRFEGLVTAQTGGEVDALFADPTKEAVMLEYWNTWEITDPKKQFEDSQKAAAALLVGAPSEKQPRYDFFLVHALTSSHAIRILVSLLPAEWHLLLVRQWWLFALSAYVMELRPVVDISRVVDYDTNGRGWEYVDQQALKSDFATDAHFVKGCRALRVAAETWGDPDQFYLKAAVRFAEEFNHWGGASY
ncbi:Questin oxidase-like protein 2 [Elsinoe fawcettii]|nr:Questin oxidase-like protein 2 [Elsinoe fawcettii]